jgi:ABC-type sugar transport system permease subunit
LARVGFTEFLGGERPFVGLANYIKLFGTPLFIKSVTQTLVFTLETLILQVSIGLALALMMNRGGWTSKLLFAVVLWPWAIPPVASGIIWKFLFDSDHGWINGLFYQLGIFSSYKPLLSNPHLALELLAFGYSWRVVPFSALLFYAALKSIPEYYYEAAKMDGANALRQFLYITLPLLKPTFLVILVLRTLFSLRVFGDVVGMTYGGPGDDTWTWSFYIYIKTFESMRFDIAAAAALLMGLLTLFASIVYIKLLYSEVRYE